MITSVLLLRHPLKKHWMFLRAARHGELDMMHGVSANIMCGQEGNFGTNSFQVFLDMTGVKDG